MIPPTKLEVKDVPGHYDLVGKVQYKGDPKHLEVISLFFQPNAKQLQQLGRFWMQNHQFKKMIMLRPFRIGLTLE